MSMEEPLFDPSLKKRKPKKKTVAFNEDGEEETTQAAAPTALDTLGNTPMPAPASAPAPTSPAPGPSILKQPSANGATGDVEGITKAVDDFGFADLKKKKKKKEIPLDFDAEAPAAAAPSGEAEDGAAPAGDDMDFSDIKKKKKKSTKKATFADLDAFEKELGGGEDAAPATRPSKAATMDGDEDGLGGEDDDEADLGEDVFAIGAAPVDVGDDQETWHGTDRDYTYAELLGRITKTLRLQNPELSGRKRYTIVPPSAHREGNKKTIFANISEICKRMHRQPEHVIQFLFAELGTTGTVDGQQRLVIKGRFQQKQLETVLRRYIVEYVTCKICKSPDTLLSKENRLYFMTCESCGSRRSVSAVKTGFQAQIGKRRLTKPAT
ncbi:hypothetical protein FRB94_006687 [Tulasnella sp. JGI-2019a]|nr:hypothetical protein FRB93_008504 [Tulasnella sp. JGI-2019a]KAG8998754.1 hypothetical protein FRB94_006687 [Tulasnella sp. JGI-2019a]KAG9031469.1 hypothetical protein FRB95_002715 [Tulasnella sp. JGI-2019a]